MATRRKIALILIVVAGGVLATAVLLTLVFFNLDRYRVETISYLEQDSGKKTEIERLALTFFPSLTVHIYGLGVKSPPPFPPGYLVKVAQADVVISPWSLLRGAVAIKSVVLKDLAINVLSAPDGRWNFENPRAASLQNTFPLGIIDKVVIERAQLTVSNLLPSGAAGPAFVEAHDIASQLTVVNLAAIVNPSTPSLNGQGTWRAGRLRFGAVETTDVQSTIRLDSWKVSIADVKANAYSGTLTGAFSLNLAGKNASVTADAQIRAIDVAQVLAAFHQERVGMTGIMEGGLTLVGEIEHTQSPLTGLNGTGHLRVTHGHVAGLLSNPSVRKLESFSDPGRAGEDPSSFSSITADLRLADLWVSSKAIAIEGHGVALDGSGRVHISGAGELDYRGLATIAMKQEFWTNTFARLGGATLKDGKLSFPFRIEGTVETPKFSKATNGK